MEDSGVDSGLKCTDLGAFMTKLNNMRKADDSIVVSLNNALPTKSFPGCKESKKICNDFRKQLTDLELARGAMITRCIAENEAKVASTTNHLEARMLAMTLRQLRGESDVEAVVVDRAHTAVGCFISDLSSNVLRNVSTWYMIGYSDFDQTVDTMMYLHDYYVLRRDHSNHPLDKYDKMWLRSCMPSIRQHLLAFDNAESVYQKLCSRTYIEYLCEDFPELEEELKYCKFALDFDEHIDEWKLNSTAPFLHFRDYNSVRTANGWVPHWHPWWSVFLVVNEINGVPIKGRTGGGARKNQSKTWKTTCSSSTVPKRSSLYQV